MFIRQRLYFILLLTFGCHLTSFTLGEEDNEGTLNAEEIAATEEVEAEVEEGPQETVTIFQGDVKGFKESSSKGKVFYSYLGIPYAKPPVGTLRFKDPEPLMSWEGTFDASTAPPHCPQIDIYHFIVKSNPPFTGEEDCLYLNVFTPKPNVDKAYLPVLVYFHDGFFVSGGASDYEPYDILNEDVVLVVIQFRLGVLGFLSTEDLVIPGNSGLKDQTLALRWVHENIEKFGGDSLKVTLFGSGSGAASVHFQTLTHHTIGLFSRAILQSGTAICPWAQGGVHKEVAFHLGQKFDCPKKKVDTLVSHGETEVEEKVEKEDSSVEKEPKQEKNEEFIQDTENEQTSKTQNENVSEDQTAEKKKESITENERMQNDENNKGVDEKDDGKEGKKDDEAEEEQLTSEELLECLQNVSAEELTKAVKSYYMLMFMPTTFGPYVDDRYIPGTPEHLLKEKRHKRLDLIVGINKDDGALHSNALFASEGRRMALKQHFPLIGPISLEFSDEDIAPLNMSIKAYDKYSGGLKIDDTDVYNLTRLFTDRHYAVCSDVAALKQAENNVNKRYKRSVYFYELQHRGQRSLGDAMEMSFGKEWVSHGDELYYLFPMNKTKDFVREEEDSKLSELMIKMWTRFAATGNPTPDDSLGFTWDTFTSESASHLVLQPQPEMENDTRKEIREFWSSLPTKQNIVLFKENFVHEKDSSVENTEDYIKEQENKENSEEGKENSETENTKEENEKTESYEKTEL